MICGITLPPHSEFECSSQVKYRAWPVVRQSKRSTRLSHLYAQFDSNTQKEQSDRGSTDHLYLHHFLLCQMRLCTVCVFVGQKDPVPL